MGRRGRGPRGGRRLGRLWGRWRRPASSTTTLIVSVAGRAGGLSRHGAALRPICADGSESTDPFELACGSQPQPNPGPLPAPAGSSRVGRGRRQRRLAARRRRSAACGAGEAAGRLQDADRAPEQHAGAWALPRPGNDAFPSVGVRGGAAFKLGRGKPVVQGAASRRPVPGLRGVAPLRCTGRRGGRAAQGAASWQAAAGGGTVVLASRLAAQGAARFRGRRAGRASCSCPFLK